MVYELYVSGSVLSRKDPEVGRTLPSSDRRRGVTLVTSTSDVTHKVEGRDSCRSFSDKDVSGIRERKVQGQ